MYVWQLLHSCSCTQQAHAVSTCSTNWHGDKGAACTRQHACSVCMNAIMAREGMHAFDTPTQAAMYAVVCIDEAI
eukprot:358478-Chlamydomonas_euryale.AAC.22